MSIFKTDSQNPTFSPSYFSSEAIPPEVLAFNQALEEQIAQSPSYLDLSLQEIRSLDQANASERSLLATDRYIPGPAVNPIKLRQFIPDQIKGVYLFIHGGGWVSGASDWQDKRLERIANEVQVAVISVEYRLAPEHPYPAPVDDCEAAALWLIQNAQQEFGTDQILIGGGSAGAHLCALTLVRMRDKHAYTQFLGANLVFGIYDLTMTPSMRNWGDRELILSTPIVERLLNCFVPKDVDRRDPAVSPYYANLKNMPKALFTIGTMDPLLDDSLMMYMRWLSAGNEAELMICPGGVHGFIAMPTIQAEEATAEIIAFLQSCFT